MNKSLIALATAAVAIAATVSQAEAGHGFHLGFGGIGLGFGAFHNSGSYEAPRRVYHERVQERAPVHARKSNVAQDDDKQADKTVAQNENSSITVAAVNLANTENSSITVASTAEAAKIIEPVKITETKKSEPAVAQKLDCKKFFPSVGLTLTAPCE